MVSSTKHKVTQVQVKNRFHSRLPGYILLFTSSHTCATYKLGCVKCYCYFATLCMYITTYNGMASKCYFCVWKWYGVQQNIAPTSSHNFTGFTQYYGSGVSHATSTSFLLSPIRLGFFCADFQLKLIFKFKIRSDIQLIVSKCKWRQSAHHIAKMFMFLCICTFAAHIQLLRSGTKVILGQLLPSQNKRLYPQAGYLLKLNLTFGFQMIHSPFKI